MNLEQLKKKVAEISKSTATSHPKIVIVALCAVIQELIVEIDKIQNPKMTILTTEEDGPRSPYPTKARPQEEETERPRRTPPLIRPNRYRPLNAGDAE